MKTYKVLSIVFIVICVGLMAGVLFFMNGQAGHKVILVSCLAVVILAMSYNLSLISKKQKQQ